MHQSSPRKITTYIWQLPTSLKIVGIFSLTSGIVFAWFDPLSGERCN